MGRQASQLLEAFEALPPEDKQALAVEILRRTRELPFDSGPLTDEEIGETGRALFAFLDRDENGARARWDAGGEDRLLRARLSTRPRTEPRPKGAGLSRYTRGV